MIQLKAKFDREYFPMGKKLNGSSVFRSKNTLLTVCCVCNIWRKKFFVTFVSFLTHFRKNKENFSNKKVNFCTYSILQFSSGNGFYRFVTSSNNAFSCPNNPFANKHSIKPISNDLDYNQLSHGNVNKKPMLNMNRREKRDSL